MKKFAIGLYAAIVVALMVWGFYQAMYVSPDDAMQGEIFTHHLLPRAIVLGGVSVLCRQPYWLGRLSFLPQQPAGLGPDRRRMGAWPEQKSESSSAP